MNIPFLGDMTDIIITGGLQTLGTKLKNKDTNTTGADDAAGNALIAVAPLVPSIIHGDVRGQRKSVDAAIAGLQAYRAALGD